MKQRVKIAVLCILIVCIGAIIGWFIYSNSQKISVPDSVTRSVDFTIILPSSIPRGFEVSSGPAYESASRVVVTELQDKNSIKVIFSQQAKPNVDLKQIDTKEMYLIDAGSVYILKGEPKRFQAIVETEDSWVLINADETIGLTRFKQLLSELAVAS